MKTIFKLITFIAVLSALTACVFHVGHNGSSRTANLTIDKTLELDASLLSQLNIDAGAGSLNIVGSESKLITVTAKIRTDEEKNYTLTLETSGTKAQLVANQSSFGSWSGTSPYIDLTITVPNTLALDIDDGSGAINISRINNNINLVDGSGSIEVSKVTGDLNIKDGSGRTSLNHVIGNIELDDGSGEIEIHNTTGNIIIDDGSGSLSVVNTSGKVTVDDGSGDIYIQKANGLTIIESGSGGLKVSDISGKMDIGN